MPVERSSGTVPPRLQEIVEEFNLCEGSEKLDLLLEYADKMPPLPEWLREKREQMERVHECMTPVFIHAELEHGRIVLYFDVPQEAPTVRGYASVLREGLNGTTPDEVIGLPVHFYEHMGLQHLVGPQRLNGLTAMLLYIKRLAFQKVKTA